MAAASDQGHEIVALSVDDHEFTHHRIACLGGVEGLPRVLNLLDENMLGCAGPNAEQLAGTLASWEPSRRTPLELKFQPGRVLIHDLTGGPALVYLATLRSAVARRGGDQAAVQPSVPVDPIIDHSLTVAVASRPDAVTRNIEIEYRRNGGRYRFLKWAGEAVGGVTVVPPGAGIVHQVNIEHLAEVVTVRDGVAFPDTLIGTDSHTTMANGLGVLAWGVAGIEALAAMLGQGIVLRVPEVIGVELAGALPEGSTATDMVLRITQLLRDRGVVGAFVEFHGPGVGAISVPDRTAIANMSPEFGSTCALFPIDDRTLEYLRLTGPDAKRVALVEAYAKAQGLWSDPDVAPRYSDHLILDLSTVRPSTTGPSRPERRIELDDAAPTWRKYVRELVEDCKPGREPEHDGDNEQSGGSDQDRTRHPVEVQLDGVELATLDHGHVAIAAIASCTNTSNPMLMLGAALLARNAVQRGLRPRLWVKTSLEPGSPVVMDYVERAQMLPYLEQLGFGMVGFGCTTRVGNSSPVAEPVRAAVADQRLKLASVPSGNRNFEGPETPAVVTATPPVGTGRPPILFEVAIRRETDREVTYHRHGGILPFVLRSMLDARENGGA